MVKHLNGKISFIEKNMHRISILPGIVLSTICTCGASINSALRNISDFQDKT